MKSPLVSVIVPVYNVERYLNRCLNSIISQTFKDIEIICVNDGSTDTSLKILKEYQKIDNRIIVINKENEGVSKSRNKGIEVAKGEYIVFVDSDDWINLDMVEYMYNKAKNTDTDIVMCTYMREYINNSKEKVFNLPDEIIFEDNNLKYDLYRKLFGPIGYELFKPDGMDSLGTVWGKLYKSDIIKKNNVKFVNLDIIGSNEDSLFNIYTFKFASKILFINKPLYHYWRQNENSLTTKYNPNLMKQWHRLFEYMYDVIDEENLDNIFCEALENRICMSVLGLGLNECSEDNTLSRRNKIQNIKNIQSDFVIRKAYKKFNIEKFPLHWKIFYIFNKKRMAFASYCMLNTIQFLRKII